MSAQQLQHIEYNIFLHILRPNNCKEKQCFAIKTVQFKSIEPFFRLPENKTSVIARFERSSNRGNPAKNRRFFANATGVVTHCFL